MAKIVNLSKFRKQNARNKKRLTSSVSASKHGRRKSQKKTEEAQNQKLNTFLDQHKRESQTTSATDEDKA